jgi:signal transduction histidine kinase/DNA-binding response OmpR family regulator/putative methionine-R-sulfoxide reductase with GAF domain
VDDLAVTEEERELAAQWSALTQVLTVLSESRYDLRQLLGTLSEQAARLTGASDVALFTHDDGRLRLVYGSGAVVADLPSGRIDLDPTTITARAVNERRVVQVADVQADPGYRWPSARRAGIRAVLAVPLLQEDELLGVLTLFRTVPEPFRPRQVELVTGFADQAMIAIAHARAVAELQERTAARERTLREMEAQREVSRAAGASLDVDTVLKTIIQHAVRLSGAAGGVIGVLEHPQTDPDAPAASRNLVLRASHGVEDDVLDLLRKQSIRLARRQIRGQPVEVPDLAALPVGLPDSAQAALVELGYRSYVSLPLCGPTGVLGAMSVASRVPGGFAPEVVSLLAAFAGQSAVAVYNAGLYAEAEEQSRRLADRVRDSDRLYQLACALQEPLSLREKLTRVLEVACGVVGVDRVYIWVVTPARDGFRNLAGAGFNPEEMASFEEVVIPFHEAGAMYECFRRGTPMLFDGDHPLPPELRIAPRLAHLPGLRASSLVFVPMLARGAVVGLIAADNKPSRRRIEATSIEMLSVFGASAAVAVENARLFTEIAEQRHELEVAGRHTSQFLANMSHELRTPLNAIIGYSEILREEAEDVGATAFVPDLMRISAAGRRLLELVNAVLDLSKIEAGKMDLYLEAVDVAELLREVGRAAAPLAAARGNQLSVACGPELGTMRTDGQKLRTVLSNLVDNACKFTLDGTVTVGAVHRRDADDVEWVDFTVTDTGIGVSPEQIDALFREFAQGDSSPTRRYSGCGLGLALSRRLCRLMGGDIDVESRLGAGSTFTARLPASVADRRAPTAADDHGVGTPRTQPATVLVVDDEPAARELLTRVLVRDGLRVITAANGEEALRLARTTAPNAITLDVLMPGMDGWSVLSALKADPVLAAIPVILLTITEDRTRGYALGVTEYLTKPVDHARLLAAIARHRTSPGEGHVLVVEDDPLDRQLICQALVDAGLAVAEAGDGREALAALDARRPAMVVLDLMLPGVDGFTVLDELRRRGDHPPVPVLVVTAKELTAADRSRLNGGVEHILHKNADVEEQVIPRVRDLVMSYVRP